MSFTHAVLRLVVELGGVGLQQLSHSAALAPGLLIRAKEELEEIRLLREGDEHFCLTGFDPLGDVDLALAIEELDCAHLAQIHPNGIVGLFQLFGSGGLGLGLGRRLFSRGTLCSLSPFTFVRVSGFSIHDVDVELGEAHVYVVELLSDTGHLFRQVIVQLFIHDEAAFLTRLNKLAELGILLFNLHARLFHHRLPPFERMNPGAPTICTTTRCRLPTTATRWG